MSAKVDQTPVVESHNPKMSASSGATTATTTGGPKVSSMFAAKSGFVIPKNKLSGSLVPIFRGGKRPGTNDLTNEESTKSVQRKTKWGPDLTLDASVRKGRALAYQTRVDQIMQQLNSGSLEPEGNQDSQVADKLADPKASTPQIDTENSEPLELEKREAIGEILKLNPTYKAPPDYKPLLKEASVPIPVKEYPGYNFIGLIFGPGSETQKRLEKETGAKIQVYGTKANTEEKVEISPSNGTEAHVAYEELSVHTSADTFDKVDAAVSLIELLLTSVPGNLVPGDYANVPIQSKEASTPFVVPTVANQGLVQPAVGPTQTPQQGQFQYQNPWFPGVTPQVPVHPSSGLIRPQTSSAPIFNNPANTQSSPFNASTMPSLFGPRPVPSSGFNSVLQDPSLIPTRPQQPMQVSSNPYPPRNFPMPAPQPSHFQANVLASLPSTGSQPLSIGPYPVIRPSLPQPVSTLPPGQRSDRPLTPVRSSSGWSGASATVPASFGPGDMGQTAPPIVPMSGPWPVVPQSGFPSSALPPNMSAANIVSPVSFASGSSSHQSSSIPMNHSAAPTFASVPTPRVGPSPAPAPVQSSPVVASLPNSSLNSVLGSMPTSSPMTPTSKPTLHSGIMGPLSGATANFTPLRSPSVTAPKLQHSGPGHFTFQPHHVQNASQTVPRLSSETSSLGAPPPRLVMQPPAPQAPSFGLAVPNSIPPGMHMFPRSQLGSQMVQTQANMSAVPFAGNPTGSSVSPRLPAFPNSSQVGPPVLQMGSRNFSPNPQPPNLAGPLPPRPGNSVQLQQNYPGSMALRGQFMGLHQPLNKHLSFASGRPASSQGGQQIYDPFSPTSASIQSQQQGGNPVRGKQESDPEYEDLMASVGVQ